jgi:hypothetical protein
VSREVEGLPWPEGDPDGLRGIATHAVGLATELEHRQAFVRGLDPTGWLGVGRDEFAVSLAEHAHALGSGATAMHQASTALFRLATTVEDAQRTVLDAARKLKAARDAAHRAQSYAQSARATANTDGLKLLTGPLSTPGNPVKTPSEIEADRAENAAVTAQTHALDVERWAQRQARTANDHVSTGDRATAAVLEHDGLLSPGGMPGLVGVAPPTPTDPLKALGRLLLGPVGSQGDLGLKALLSSPPAPPPPPPKPVPQHHSSFWNKLAVGGMAVVTTGLVVVDALQLGLDPVTDGATVAAGGETAALATDAAIDTEVVAGTTAAGSEAAGTETEESIVAAEGAPSEGLTVQEGATDAPVRPSWQDSETNVENDLAGQGYRKQVSFKDGEEVPYGTKGSTRPDHYTPGNSVEVKNYDVSTSAGRSNLVRNVVDQAAKRAANLPEGTTQSLRIDVRGQSVSVDTLNEMASRIAARTGGKVDMSQIRFIFK